MKKFPNATENILRIAVTQDAIRLWRLLLPDSSSLCEEKPVPGPSTSDPYAADPSVDIATSTPPSPDSLGIPASLIWDVSIVCHLLLISRDYNVTNVALSHGSFNISIYFSFSG